MLNHEKIILLYKIIFSVLIILKLTDIQEEISLRRIK